MDVIQDAALSRRQLCFSLAFGTHVHRQSQVSVRLTTCEIHSNGHLDYGVSYKLRRGVGGVSLSNRFQHKKDECTLNEPKKSCLHAEIFINGLSAQSERICTLCTCGSSQKPWTKQIWETGASCHSLYLSEYFSEWVSRFLYQCKS